MTKVLRLLKFLKDPHTEKIKQLKERSQELDDLSNVAVEIGNAAVYKSLQTEMKEVFFDYLTAVLVDSVYRLVPHVLIIWVISLKWQSVTVPLVNWKVSIFGVYLLMYLIFHVGQMIPISIKSRLWAKSGLSDATRSSVTGEI